MNYKQIVPVAVIVVAGFSFLVLQQALAVTADLRVWFFNIGQGDAIFIETPTRHQILVDGGPDARILEKLGERMPFWDHSLDMVILTHPEADHLTGLLSVLERYDVDAIIETGIRKETILSQAWDEAVKNENAAIILADGPKRIWFGERFVLDILWPDEDKNGEALDKPNEFSVVARLAYGNKSFFLSGDIERWAEQQLLARNIDIDADILKVPHHGSETSTGEAFLAAVSPSIAVISVGENRYGHPHQTILKRLAASGVQIVRTDERGDILISSDGREVKIK